MVVRKEERRGPQGYKRKNKRTRVAPNGERVESRSRMLNSHDVTGYVRHAGPPHRPRPLFPPPPTILNCNFEASRPFCCLPMLLTLKILHFPVLKFLWTGS